MPASFAQGCSRTKEIGAQFFAVYKEEDDVLAEGGPLRRAAGRRNDVDAALRVAA